MHTEEEAILYSWKFLRDKSLGDYLFPAFHKLIFKVQALLPMIIILKQNFKVRIFKDRSKSTIIYKFCPPAIQQLSSN